GRPIAPYDAEVRSIRRAVLLEARQHRRLHSAPRSVPLTSAIETAQLESSTQSECVVMTTVKASGQLTLRDRLSRLTFEQACKLLGPEGRKLIQRGSQWEVNLDEDVYLGGDLFRLKCPG